jgi:hypothetical protein
MRLNSTHSRSTENATPIESMESILSQRLSRIESILQTLVEQRTVKDWYTTSEIAEILRKADFTIREWCRLGRIRAEKRQSGRGPHAAWVISNAELLRYQREGLIPLPEYG